MTKNFIVVVYSDWITYDTPPNDGKELIRKAIAYISDGGSVKFTLVKTFELTITPEWTPQGRWKYVYQFHNDYDANQFKLATGLDTSISIWVR